MALKKLDVRGARYPIPIVKAKKELDTMAPGNQLEVTAIHPGVVACSHHMGRWKLEGDGQRQMMATVSLRHEGTSWTLRREKDVLPFASADPDTSRIWLSRARPAILHSPDGTRRPYWLLRPLKPGRVAYRHPGWTPLGA